MSLAFTLIAILTAFTAQTVGGQWQEGVQYERVDPPRPTAVANGKIEVLEFFGYWCPHCRSLEPELERWSQGEPRDVVLVRIPVVWEQPVTRGYARLFYTLRALGRLDLQGAVYDSIDRGVRTGRGRLTTFEQQREFAVAEGIAASRFERVYGSDQVSAAVERAETLERAYAIERTPTLIVQGTYRTDRTRFPADDELFGLLDSLIGFERAALRARISGASSRP